MRYKLLGKSGLRVSELCLGTMTFGEEWGWGASKEDSHKIFDAFVEAGGNFFDTANAYTNGTSEKFIGEFIAGERERFVVATKYTGATDINSLNSAGNQRKSMVHSLEGSLIRMKIDYIDLLWVHFWDVVTPIEEVMRALDDMVRAGKVLYVGISDTPAWVISQANTLAELRGWSPFIGMQISYGLIERTPERELLPMAKALEIGVTAYGALGAGVLTGKYTGKKDRPAHSRGPMGERYLMGRNPEIAEEVVKIAEEIGCTPAQVALDWVRQQPYGIMIPIFGARKMSQLEDNLGCLELKLDNDQLGRLNQISQIDLGFPHYFQNRDLVEQSRSQIELNHALDFMNRDFLKGWSSIFSSK